MGGEWYYNAHPDFLWTPTPGSRALSSGDQHLIAAGQDTLPWDGKTSLPAAWLPVAQKSASHGSPLALVVEGLVHLSSGH